VLTAVEGTSRGSRPDKLWVFGTDCSNVLHFKNNHRSRLSHHTPTTVTIDCDTHHYWQQLSAAAALLLIHINLLLGIAT
jgi:hypothetical protein